MTLRGASTCINYGIFAAITGEVGVLHQEYPVGDVRRYGVSPDGTTNWELDYYSRMAAIYANSTLSGIVVFWPAGMYATGMNLSNTYSGSKMVFAPGAIFGGVVHLISSPSPTTIAISSIVRASGVVTVTTTGAHSFASGDRKRIAGVLYTSTPFNTYDTGAITVTGSTTFTYVQAGTDETGTVSGTLPCVIEVPLRNVVFGGLLTTCDRLGAINLVDSNICETIIKNDPANHTAFPGTKPRGIHIYEGTTDCTFGKWLVEDCGNANNTDAAVSIDGVNIPPMGLKFADMHVANSDVHGVYIMGDGHETGSIRVDAFSALQNQNNLVGANSLAQSQEGKGVWLNRLSGTSIASISVSNKNAGSAYAKYSVMIDETGNLSITATRGRPVNIGPVTMCNVASYGGLSLGDRNYATTGELNVRIESAALQLQSGATLTSTYQGLIAAKNPGYTYSNIQAINFIDFVSQPQMKIDSGAILEYGNIDSRIRTSGATNNGQLFEAVGSLRGGDISYDYIGGSSASPLLYFNASSDSNIGNVYASAVSSVSTQLLKMSSTTRVNVGVIRGSNFRNATGTVEASGLTSCTIGGVSLSATVTTSTVGMLVNGMTGSCFGRVDITGFALGVKKGAGTITRSTVINANVSGNTVNTDIPADSFSVVQQTGFQL